jgi:hypothetical protein
LLCVASAASPTFFLNRFIIMTQIVSMGIIIITGLLH